MVTGSSFAPRDVARRIAAKLPGPLARRFAADERGLSALEFALILPIMVGLYLGGVEVGDAFTIKRKVTNTASALADLVAQSRTVSANDIKNIFDVSEAMIVPYEDDKLKMRISGIEIDSKGKATVKWSDARNHTAFAKNAAIAVPDGVNQKDTFLVLAEVHYDYKPTFGYVLTGTFDLNEQFYLRPRISNDVDRVP